MTIKDKADIWAVEAVESIIRAAKKHKDEPEKVEAFIRRKGNILYELGTKVGKTSLTDDLFNGSHW
jgi:hypothetical protein